MTIEVSNNDKKKFFQKKEITVIENLKVATKPTKLPKPVLKK
tara:strand:+ start:16639 stop:16764 length:126 start_codon:yes stop_codon:yes gene_type:complete